ncbi:MAG: histidine phosphatase family protein [Desulfuromonadales bacterium]|nr:histidine phosphatase family protein [Desulfuromonadales bacterium]
MKKQGTGYAVLAIVFFTFFIVVTWGFLEAKETGSVLENNGKEAFNLTAQWAQGNVVALVRHAERCDRSENQCLDGDSGITVSGKSMSIKLGNDFRSLLDVGNADIYNSPVKRTQQTAQFMFGRSSIDKNWLVDDCRSKLLGDIFDNKENGRNMVLVTHSTCINNLKDPDGKTLINLHEIEKETYGITIFLAVNKHSKQAYVLGYLGPNDWSKVANYGLRHHI